MNRYVILIMLFYSIKCGAQKAIISAVNLENGISKVYYDPFENDNDDTLYIKYYINEQNKKFLPLLKVNGKFEATIKTDGFPCALFFTIDSGKLSKFDDNLRKGYCILLNVKNSEDSILAYVLKVKYMKDKSFLLMTNSPSREEYLIELELIKEKITPIEFEYFKLDYINYKFGLNQEKYKDELLQYLSTLENKNDENLQAYICAIYRRIYGDSVGNECYKQLKLKIPDSDLNAFDFTDSLQNTNLNKDKEFVFAKMKEFELRFPKQLPKQPGFLFNVYNRYLEEQIKNRNFEEIMKLVSKVKFDKISLAKGICDFSKSEFSRSNKNDTIGLNFYEKLVKIAIEIIEATDNDDDLHSNFYYEKIAFSYSTYAYFLSHVKKHQEAFSIIKKSLAMKPNDMNLIETSSLYARNAFGDLFTKKYIENIAEKYGTSDGLLLLLKDIHQNLVVPESESKKIELSGIYRNIELKESEIIKYFGDKKAPNFELLDFNNKSVNLQDFKGQKVFIYFWATWCGPCISSMPNIMKLKEKYKDVNFVLIDTWENKQDVRSDVLKLLNTKRYSFQVLLDLKNKAAEVYKIEALPTKFLIDQNGNIELLNPSLLELDEYLGKK